MKKFNSAHDRHLRYLIKHKKASRYLHYTTLDQAIINAGLSEEKNDN